MMKLHLLYFAQWLIDRVSKRPPDFTQTREQERIALALLWATQSVRDFIEHREKHLIYTGMDNFINGKLTEARGLGGQLVELRAMKGRMSGAWAEQQHQKLEDKRRQVLATEKNIS